MAFTQIDVERCRQDFPALKRTQNGVPLAFLDGPAGVAGSTDRDRGDFELLPHLQREQPRCIRDVPGVGRAGQVRA